MKKRDTPAALDTVKSLAQDILVPSTGAVGAGMGESGGGSGLEGFFELSIAKKR